MPPSFVAVAASTWQQHVLACHQLGLPVNGTEGIVVMYCDDWHKVTSLVPQRVIFVEPRLEQTITDRLRHDEVRHWLLYRAERAGVEVEVVTT